MNDYLGQQYINGQWQFGQGDDFISKTPFQDEVLWQGGSASEQQVEAALSAAREAFYQWKHTSLDTRLEHLKAYADLVKRAQEKIATTIAQETGKPLWESQTEVAAMQSKLQFSIESYQNRTGHMMEKKGDNQVQLQHKPIGVLAVFGPYNFPCHLPNGHIIPALLAGNCVVFKPSEQTPLCGELMVRLWEQAGLPSGVLNLVQGAKAVGVALSSSIQIDGVLFTGSAATGQALHQQMAGQVNKMLALEMGGNNPLVIGEDYGDLDACVFTIIQSAFLSAGQRCTCARRLILPATPAGDALLDAVIATSKQLKVGEPLAQEQPFMGSLISPTAAQSIIQAQQDLVERGATPLLQGQLLPPAFVTPAILDVSQAKDVPDEEYFGPLLQVYRYQSFDQAISLANQTRYGLSAGLISQNKEQWDEFQDKIRAGVVNWNRPITGASGDLPFGGVGASGNFRASAYYAADYCAYPMASVMGDKPQMPSTLPPGMVLNQGGCDD
ncbi:MAG: succinylglutamate-semialdehyde dehydrogenase [Vibrio sp.]